MNIDRYLSAAQDIKNNALMDASEKTRRLEMMVAEMKSCAWQSHCKERAFDAVAEIGVMIDEIKPTDYDAMDAMDLMYGVSH